MMITIRTALLVALVVVVAACGASDESADDGGDASSSSTAQTTSTTRLDVDPTPVTTKVPDVTLPPGDEENAGSPPEFAPGDNAVAFAIADLAYRLGVSEEAVTLVEQTEVVWRDGSLGCPVPGMSYTQALVDGSRIILEVDGVEYSYHQGRGAPFLCENPAE